MPLKGSSVPRSSQQPKDSLQAELCCVLPLPHSAPGARTEELTSIDGSCHPPTSDFTSNRLPLLHPHCHVLSLKHTTLPHSKASELPTPSFKYPTQHGVAHKGRPPPPCHTLFGLHSHYRNLNSLDCLLGFFFFLESSAIYYLLLVCEVFTVLWLKYGILL